MDKRRKTKKKSKLPTSKKKSCPSISQLRCAKNAVVRLEKLSDSFVAEMTASRPALLPEQIMEFNDEALNINAFPDEMLINIFSLLSQNELGKIARVCKRWNVLTKDPDLWKEVNVNFYKSHKFQDTVIKCFVKMLRPSVVRIRLYFGDRECDPWDDLLNFKELSMEFQTRCPALRMLILEGAEFSESLHSIIDSCTEFLQNVKILVLDSCGFPTFPTKKGKKIVGTSKIEVLDLSWSWLRPFDLSAFLKLPNLKQFHCCSMNLNVYLDDDISLYNSFFNQLRVLDFGEAVICSRTFQAICRGLNLEELYACNSLDDDDFNFNKPVFPRLKTICLRETPTLTCKAVISLMQSCQSLQNAYVTQDLAVSCAAHPFFVANKCKLEILKIIPDCDEHRRVAY